MVINRIRQTLKYILYDTYFGSLVAEREKALLRSRVITLPITSDYPFDVEAKLLRFIGIKPSVMLDIGANTGFYSAVLEDIVGADNLFIFEPLPHLYQQLKRRFKKAHVFGFALSSKEGKQNIRVPYIDGKRFDTRATFNAHAEPDQTGFDEIEVRLFPLDYIAKKVNFNSIGFIKIDVEGHELDVLNGGIKTITQFKPLILIEIEARHHRFPITKIFTNLEGIGYKGYYLNPDSFELLEISQFNSNRDQNQEYLKSRNFIRYLNNFFFVPVESVNDFVARTSTFLNVEKELVEQVTARNI